MASMIEFTDILLESPLPLHSYLINRPCLSLRLITDGKLCGETPAVNGDLTNGTWEINSRLSAHAVRHPVTLAVVATVPGKSKCLKFQLAAVTLGVTELFERLNAKPYGTQTFYIGDSCSSIQIVMTCLLRASPLLVLNNPPSDIAAHDSKSAQQDEITRPSLTPVQADQPVNKHTNSDQSNYDQESSELPSRETLESFYAKATRIPDRGERKARGLSMLGRAYYALYQKEHGRADLEMAISLQEEALQCAGPFHPQVAEHAHYFSITLMTRFEQTGDIVDIERAVSNLQNALSLTEDFDAEKPGRLSSLGIAFQLRFDRLGDVSDLQNSITFQQRAVDVTPDGHPNKPGRLSSLGIAFQLRFDRLGDVSDLQNSITFQQRAVDVTPDGHPNKSGRLSNLGAALISRFGRAGILTDIEDAVSNFRRAVEQTLDGDSDKPSLFSNLGAALQSRFGRLGRLEDLEESIDSLQQAIRLTPDSHPDKPSLLNNLGNALETRFDRLGNLADLEDAILHKQKAVELMPDGDPDKPSLFNNLGSALETRFDRLGNLADLENAVSNKQKAVDLTPDDNPDKPGQLSNLGSALETRFDRLGNLADLEDAILHKQKAVELMPDGDPDKPSLFNNLGNALEARFNRLGNRADLENAISNKQKAADLTPDDNPDKPGQLSNLGNALESRYGHLRLLEDLEDAIDNFLKAIQLTPDGHRRKAGLFNNVSIALRSRFLRLNNISDLEDAISNLKKGIELVPEGHPAKSRYLFNLGNTFVARFKHLNILSDLEGALSAFSSAAISSSGSARHRFNAARSWAKLSEAASRSPLDAFRCAIDLLPRIAWLGLAVTDQHALLADVGDIVRDAVAAAIRYEEYETAIVWAEQGRSIVWQNLLGLRNPVEDLRGAHPELAGRLQNVAQQLEGTESHDVGMAKTSTASVGDAHSNHSRLAIEWDNLIDEIRSIPQFEGFLGAKSFDQLAPAAHGGPVVILNVNDTRCDALVLIADDSAEQRVSAVNIPLERFSHGKSKNMFRKLTELLTSAGVRERNGRKTGRAQSSAESNAKFKVILGILWKDVVKPVIEGLAFQTESKRPPRIWWCATGILAFLPIHAAGLYDSQEIGDKLSDYVVSSYTPTLTAILDPSDPVVQDDFQVLTVAQASAPGAQPIPKTEEEVKMVHDLTVGARRVNLTGENATVQCVQEAMLESNWIHLACHGQQDSTDAMSSGFLLHDRTLKLSEIVKMKLPKADFAFLSACQTAMGDEKVAEESVHLAAGMLLSGCRGVIATTWSIRDDDAPMIAQEVYTRMFKGGEPNRKEAAYALHEAVKVLRNSGAQCVSWVPFIHIGR